MQENGGSGNSGPPSIDSGARPGGMAIEKPKKRYLLDEDRQAVLNWVRDQRRNVHRLTNPSMEYLLPNINDDSQSVQEDGRSPCSSGTTDSLESIPAYASAFSIPARSVTEDPYTPLIVTSPPFKTYKPKKSPVSRASTERSTILAQLNLQDQATQTTSLPPGSEQTITAREPAPGTHFSTDSRNLSV
ncbi:hypothetical protein J1614_002962 [Plenodomus biglobosus]|nr:hypothetical protein J1614_002962 [Plenodomus biglobosus]